MSPATHIRPETPQPKTTSTRMKYWELERSAQIWMYRYIHHTDDLSCIHVHSLDSINAHDLYRSIYEVYCCNYYMSIYVPDRRVGSCKWQMNPTGWHTRHPIGKCVGIVSLWNGSQELSWVQWYILLSSLKPDYNIGGSFWQQNSSPKFSIKIILFCASHLWLFTNQWQRVPFWSLHKSIGNCMGEEY